MTLPAILLNRSDTTMTVIFEDKEYDVLSGNDTTTLIKRGSDIRCVPTKDLREAKAEDKPKQKTRK